MEAAVMEKVEVEEGLVDNEAALKRRPRSRSTSTAFTTIVEPVKAMEENGSQQEGEETERSVYFEGNENGEETERRVYFEGKENGEETERSVYFEGNENGEETERSVHFDGNENGEETERSVYFEEKENGEETERSVYLEGNENEVIESNGSIAKEKPGIEKSDSNITKSDSQKSLATVDDHKRDGNLKDDSLYDLHLLPSEKSQSGENFGFEPFNNGLEECADVTLLKDGKQELTELDVERVIAEQDTHDLFCPNCNSCITKRVILRKRKRNIGRIHYDTKRGKIDTVLDGSSSATATNIESRGPAPPVNAHDHDTGPDIFRCLSCFTFFIPTGSGFKLFRIFGERDEHENIQSPEQIPARNVNWFSSLSESIRGKKTPEHVNVTTPCGEDEALIQSKHVPETPPVQKIDHLSNQGGHAPVNVTTQRGKGEALIESKCLPETLPVQQMDHLSNQGGRPPVNDTTQCGEDETLIQSKCLPETLPVQQMDHLSNQGGCPPVNSTTQCGEDETLIQSKCLPETLPVQQMDNLSDQGGRPPVNVTIQHGEGEALIQSKYLPEILPVQQIDHLSNQGGRLTGDDVAVQIPSGQGIHDVFPTEPGRTREWDVLKSIIYGGLIESITSLGVISSAAASDATTLNIVVLGLANLISGLIIIIHNIKELKNDHHGATSETSSNIDQYRETLGRRENFRLHAIVAVISYIVFGLLPPLTYGFSFRKTDDKLYKLITCGAASLVCIILLSIGKAHVQKPPKKYIKTVLYYLLIGVTASGLCYAVGLLIKRLLENLGLLETFLAPSTAFLETRSMKSGLAFY